MVDRCELVKIRWNQVFAARLGIQARVNEEILSQGRRSYGFPEKSGGENT